MLDYDKKFLLKSADNLTFDGSSIRGFSRQAESDLRLAIDWPAFYWLPADVFGPGKVLVFGEVCDQDGTPYAADLRARLKGLRGDSLRKKDMVGPRRERDRGLPLQGPRRRAPLLRDRRVRVHLDRRLLPLAARRHAAPLHRHLGRGAARARLRQREGPPRGGALAVRDELRLHRGDDRRRPGPALQADRAPGRGADGHDRVRSCPSRSPASTATACTPTCRSRRRARTCFYDAKGEDGLSTSAWSFLNRILANANDICLILNSSVNSYRRLDPHFEAPNQIKVSPIDRGSMVRIPIGNERSRRASRCARSRPTPTRTSRSTRCSRPASRARSATTRPTASSTRTRFLPDNIYDAIRLFKGSKYAQELLGAEVHEKYAELKLASAERCAKALGTRIKRERDPVPPRGHEPVPLEPVLDGSRAEGGHRAPLGQPLSGSRRSRTRSAGRSRSSTRA